MNTALALIEPTQYELMAKLATVAARSGYTANNEVQALFVMLKGFEIGVSPIQALEGIQVIKGKTTVSPQLMLAMINRSGLMQDMKIDGDTNQCTVTMQRVGRSAHTETFTMDNARSMNLAGNHNWKAQPATMLKWRAVSACARVVFPDVIQGMYTPEELGAEVSEDGSGDIVIEAQPTPLLDANFTQSENAVAELVANNPQPTVDTDGVIIDQDSPQTHQEGATDAQPAPSIEDSAEVAKSRFMGNGAPPAGEKKTIAKKESAPLPSWKTDLGKVYTEVRKFYKADAHMKNSIAALEAAGKLTDDMTVDLAIRAIANHKDELEAPF